MVVEDSQSQTKIAAHRIMKDDSMSPRKFVLVSFLFFSSVEKNNKEGKHITKKNGGMCRAMSEREA